MPTSPTVQDVVVKVCSIPADFHRRGDVSVVYLLEESGYDAIRDAITVPHPSAALARTAKPD